MIRYDKPGCGLSDRDGIDLSFDGQVAAALAVADAMGADRFRLFGASQGGQLAAAIAAGCPDRVEALVLYGMCASGRDLAPAAVRDSVVALVRAHWGLGLKALTGAFITDPTTDEVAAFTRAQQAGASAAVAARLLEVYYDTDIRALLPAIRARTAVLHREGDRGTRFELGREVAALIPGATLIPLPGSSHLFYHGDWAAVLDAVLGFLCEPASPGPRLTDRELEVAELIAQGLTNQAIARRLSVAPRTAEAHVENIRRKLQVRSRAQIATWVTEQRLRRDRLGISPDVRAGDGRPGQESGGIAGSSPDSAPGRAVLASRYVTDNLPPGGIGPGRHVPAGRAARPGPGECPRVPGPGRGGGHRPRLLRGPRQLLRRPGVRRARPGYGAGDAPPRAARLHWRVPAAAAPSRPGGPPAGRPCRARPRPAHLRHRDRRRGPARGRDLRGRPSHPRPADG